MTLLPVGRILLVLAFAWLVLGVAAAGTACQSNSTPSDSCEAACPDMLQCATVCPCEAGNCPSFACVSVGTGGAYFLPDGAPIMSCSTP